MFFETNRVEAFSDGVLAIAITLLVLNIAVPAVPGHGGLAGALGRQWPSYAAYVVSFLVIGIIWINHHTLFQLVKRVDRPALFANLVLLATVVAIPFPTRLLADYLRSGWNGSVAAAVYGGTMLAMSLSFSALWLVVTRDAGLLHRPLERVERRASVVRFGLGTGVYVVTIAVAFASAMVALGLHAVVAGYYAADQLSQPAGRSGPARRG